VRAVDDQVMTGSTGSRRLFSVLVTAAGGGAGLLALVLLAGGWLEHEMS
jgi:hypothetical protein